MSESTWWKTLFDQKYLDTYLGELTPERTKKEVDFVIKTANLKSTDKILDLACGHGRHSIELARRGYQAVGLDYSEPFIKKAKEDAQAAGVDVNFIQGDMKHLPFKDEFDVVLTIFTTFGYFDDEGNQQTLREISEAIKQGGRFLIDVVSGEAVTKRFQEKGEKEEGSDLFKIIRTYETEGLEVHETEWFDPNKSQIHSHREWADQGEKKEYDFYLRVYTLPQYKAMLSKAGLGIKEVWGDYEGNSPNRDNSRTIILAEKVNNPIS